MSLNLVMNACLTQSTNISDTITARAMGIIDAAKEHNEIQLKVLWMRISYVDINNPLVILNQPFHSLFLLLARLSK